MRCCESGRGCGGCGRPCDRGGCPAREEGINAVAEVEIYYCESKDREKYVLEKLNCLTNLQINKSEATGLEGKQFDTLEEMQEQAVDYLKRARHLDGGWAAQVPVFFIYSDSDCIQTL